MSCWYKIISLSSCKVLHIIHYVIKKKLFLGVFNMLYLKWNIQVKRLLKCFSVPVQGMLLLYFIYKKKKRVLHSCLENAWKEDQSKCSRATWGHAPFDLLSRASRFTLEHLPFHCRVWGWIRCHGILESVLRICCLFGNWETLIWALKSM